MRLLRKIIAAIVALAMLPCIAFVQGEEVNTNPFGDADVIYVSPKGNDKGDGTIESPLATMDAARKLARTFSKGKDVYVVFRGGTYTVRDSVKFGVADSGEDKGRVIYTSYPGEEAVFNGAEKVSGWTLYKDGIYVADVKEAENFRELYVDGVRMQRATTEPIQGMGFDDNQTALIVMTKDLPQNIKNQDCIETLNSYNWRQYWLPVNRLFKEGNYTKVYYDSAPIRRYTSKFNFEWNAKTYLMLENAFEFLDKEGEWYFDKYEKKLYYKPIAGTDINKSEVYAPIAEKFIEINGEGVSNCVENIEFHNLKFLYAGWLKPAEDGYCSVQASSMVTDSGAYGAMTPGHIEANFARNIRFEGNVIAHTATTAINFENGVYNSEIKANVFYDIGNAAVTVGSSKHNSSTRQGEIPDHISVNNNVIRFTGMGYYGAAGITYYYTTHSEIVHNDIQNTTYSGISLGWGWKKTTIQHDNMVSYNRIHNINTKVVDGAGIYSLGENQGSGYVGNYVSGVNAPFNSAALYHDQCSAGFEDYDNVVDVENESYLFYNLNDNDKIVIRDTYTNTKNIINYKANGKDIKIYNIHHVKNGEWPEKALELMDNAGLTDEYREVYDKLSTVDANAGVRKPIIGGNDLTYEEANLFYPLHQLGLDKEDKKAPYMEENGDVIIDAIDINGDYVGYEASKKAFVGILHNESWVKEYIARAIIYSQNTQYELENAEKLTKNPLVGYRINFQTPGKYRLFVRSRGDAKSPDSTTVYLDDKAVTKLSVGKTFAWYGKNSEGDVVIEIPMAGVYEIKFETNKVIYLDRIWLTQNSHEELFDGSTAPGPMRSKRDSDKAVYIDISSKLTDEEKPQMLKERVNVALNKLATASSYLEQKPKYPPKQAVNGNFTDDWLTEETKELAWWQVDLEKEYKITEIALVFRTSANQAATRRNFEILASNDPEFNTYTKLYNSGGLTVGFKEELSVCVDLEEKFRYIRVKKTAKESFGIAECRVYSEENIELDASSATFSSSKTGKYGAYKSTDNNASTYWAEGSRDNYWIKLVNNTGNCISKVQIQMRKDVIIPELFEDFEVRASDDKDFSDYVVLADNFVKEGNVLTATSNDPNPYKYIMVVKKHGFVGIAEVKAYARGTSLQGEQSTELENTDSN